MRWRDLETGTFLTRDPLSYEDGPNLYCYVHCNPIMNFDPLGLEAYAFYSLGKDETGFRNRAVQGAGENNSHGFGSGKNLMTAMQYASSKESISSADIHSHGTSAGIVGSNNKDCGFYVNEVDGSAASANVENFVELVKSGAITLEDNCDIRLFGCGNAELAQQLSEELGKMGRDDVTVTGSTSDVFPDESSPIDPKTGEFTQAKGKFETYKNGEKVGESSTQPYKREESKEPGNEGNNEEEGAPETTDTTNTTDTSGDSSSSDDQ